MANLNDFSDKTSDITAAASTEAGLSGTVQDATTDTPPQGQPVFKDAAQLEEQTEEPLTAGNNSIEYTKTCTIADDQTPILVLFGPKACGKSMTLVRLARYLRNVMCYNVEPRRDFRPSGDLIYQKRCDNFNGTINTYAPLPGTTFEEYMLCTVSDQHGNSKFQILEGPGELYFSATKKNPSKLPFPFYLDRIKNMNVPKTWCFFLEPDWSTNQPIEEYVARIISTQRFINPTRDRIVFLYNKVDKVPQFIQFGRINLKALANFASQQYKGLFAAFKNKQLIFKLFKPYLFEFVPFSTGDFSDETFIESQDNYPAALFKVIKMR